MDIQIKIGRKVDGPLDVVVPSSCCKVGREHAIIYWHDETLTIEDNESSNGTFVNGKRIAKKKITEKDVVCLGGEFPNDDCFMVDMKYVMEMVRKEEKEQRIDFSEEFEDMKRAYLEYQREASELKRRTQMTPRLLSSIPMFASLVVFLFTKDSSLRLEIMLGGSLITNIINFFIKPPNILDKMVDLQIKYQPRYCCPKCGTKYPFTTHWKKLEADGKCPNPKCNARFVK